MTVKAGVSGSDGVAYRAFGIPAASRRHAERL